MKRTKATRKAAKRNTTKPAAARVSPARKLLLSNVAPAALNEGVARNAAIAAVKAAGGNDPLVRLRYIAGRIGARLRSMGSNVNDAELISQGEAIINMAGKDAARVADGQSRRSPEQERLYGAGRVAWAALLRDAGIVANKAKDTSKTRKARTSTANKTAANSNRPASPKVKDAGALLAYGLIQAKALASTVNKNAKICPPAFSSAVQDFNAALKAIKLPA